jgi:hypothetical protein
MVLPSVSVGGVNETSAVYGQAVALTLVAVVVETVEPPELLLELPPLELLELELEPLEPELLELLEPELLELELELFEPELELLELLEPELLELELELLDPELEPFELLEPELLELELELFEPELELLELLAPELLELELELLDPELEPFELLEPELLELEVLEPELLELELELLEPELELLEPEDVDPLLLELGTLGTEATVDVATVPVEAVAGAAVSSSPHALNSIAPNTMTLTGAVIDLIVYRVMKSLNSLVSVAVGRIYTRAINDGQSVSHLRPGAEKCGCARRDGARVAATSRDYYEPKTAVFLRNLAANRL